MTNDERRIIIEQIVRVLKFDEGRQGMLICDLGTAMQDYDPTFSLNEWHTEYAKARNRAGLSHRWSSSLGDGDYGFITDNTE